MRAATIAAPRLSNLLTPLTVVGNQIVDARSGQRVLLRGVNRSGLEYCAPDGPGSLAKAGITEMELDEIILNWNANIIRLPFNQDWALGREGFDAGPYLLALDAVIEAAARRQAYTLLDLHWLDATTPRGHTCDGAVNFVPSLPDVDSIRVWQQLAARYRDEPAVLYDIFNEPHDPLPDDDTARWRIGADNAIDEVESRSVTMRDWHAWATVLVDAIRSQNQNALIFVSGTNWGYDLQGHPLDRTGLVYSTHVYRNKGTNWDEAFGALSLSVPVFVGEWGGGNGDVRWGEKLATYLADRGLGWTAWSWSDKPRLVDRRNGMACSPTNFGRLVQEHLRFT